MTPVAEKLREVNRRKTLLQCFPNDSVKETYHGTYYVAFGALWLPGNRNGPPVHAMRAEIYERREIHLGARAGRAEPQALA